MAEVTVSSQQKLIKVEADKTTIRVKDNPLLAAGDSYAAISKLPGVLELGNDLMLNGKDVTIWIDGQPTGLSGNELKNFLSGLPANVVDKIEIISNPGANYDANTAGGIINIITTKRSLSGLYGTINISYGRSKYGKANTSVQLNGRQKKIGWQLMAAYDNAKSNATENVNSTFTSFAEPKYFLNNTFTLTHYKSFYTRAGVDVFLSKKTTVGYRYNYYHSIIDNDFKNNYAVENDATITALNAIGNPNNKNDKHEMVGYFKQQIDTMGTIIEVTASSTFFNKNAFTPVTQYINRPGDISYNSYSIAGNLVNENINSIKFDVQNILLKRSGIKIQAGAKYGFNNIKSTGQYNENNQDNSILFSKIYTRNIQYNYKEKNAALYLSFSKKIKAFDILVGARVERYATKSNINATQKISDTSYTNLFPNVRLVYNFNEHLNLNISYTKKINQPGFNQLDPNVAGTFDTLSSFKGNPLLKPSLAHNVEAKLSFFDYASIVFSYSNQSHPTYFLTEAASGSLQTVNTFHTFSSIKTYTSYITLPVPFKLITQGKRFFNSPITGENMSVFFLWAGMLKSVVTDSRAYIYNTKPVGIIGASTRIVLPANFEINIWSNYLFNNGTYLIYNLNKPVTSVGMIVNKKMFNKKVMLTASVDDLFNTLKNSVNRKSPYLYVNWNKKTDSRFFKIMVSYNFGKFRSIHKKNEINISSENENDRIEKKETITPKLQ